MKMKNDTSTNIITEIFTTYAPNTDMTFILRETYSDKEKEWVSTEVVGFYYGEPDDNSTQRFIGKLKASYV